MKAKQSFEAVVANHGPTVLRVCHVIVGLVDADDAWSETFLAAMKAYPDLPDDANIEAWLVTIAHNKAIDMIRARSRQAIPIDSIPEISTAAARHESYDDLVDLLNPLPRKQKQAIAYRYLAGLPYIEVAAILGGSTDASRRATADGIASLRKALRGDPAAPKTPRKGEQS